MVDAYKRAELAGVRAGMIPDPNAPELEATHTGLMLERVTELFRSYQLRKLIYQYPEPIESSYRIAVDPAGIEVDGDVAIFEACIVDSGVTVSSETGEINGEGGGTTTYLTKIAMKRESGTWKLAESKNLNEWDGETGCAEPLR